MEWVVKKWHKAKSNLSKCYKTTVPIENLNINKNRTKRSKISHKQKAELVIPRLYLSVLLIDMLSNSHHGGDSWWQDNTNKLKDDKCVGALKEITRSKEASRKTIDQLRYNDVWILAKKEHDRICSL